MSDHDQIVMHLRQSEERFRTICENAPIMIDQFSADGQCLLWNQECVKQLGYTFEEIAACDDPLALCYPDVQERQRVLEAIRRADGTFREYRVRAKDGSIRVQMWADFILPNGQPISVGHDVTSQRAVEDQLRQAQKMETLGQLTGGMAHDFNNLLTVILANAELLIDLGPEQAARGPIREILSAATRGATLVQKLLAVGRTNTLDVQPIELISLVHDLAPTMSRLLPESIRVRVESEPSLPTVSADKGAVEQILINLITNARDALGQRGTLTIRIEPYWVDAQEAKSLQCGRGDHVCIVVEDNGVGMDESVRSRVFEPFFTTKANSGTGLGMPMVFGLMQQQGGAVWVDSEPDDGTRVHLLFPVASAKGERAAAPRRASKRVLVVEDEGSIREITVTMLDRNGYAVDAAPDGRHALELLREQDFDLVVCDLIMPGMGGQELYGAVREAGNDVPFLFVTGFADEQVLAALGDVPMLRKPFRMRQLIDTMAEVLGPST